MVICWIPNRNVSQSCKQAIPKASFHWQALGIPCYLDDLSPRSHEFPEGHRYGQRPWDFGKIFWALRLAELGYTSLYLDNDVACMADPLAPDITGSPYDLQVGAARGCRQWQRVLSSLPLMPGPRF